MALPRFRGTHRPQAAYALLWSTSWSAMIHLGLATPLLWVHTRAGNELQVPVERKQIQVTWSRSSSGADTTEDGKVSRRRSTSIYPKSPRLVSQPNSETSAERSTESLAKDESAIHAERQTLSGEDAGSRRARYLQVVVATIERNKFYPREARKLKLSGRVKVAFTIRKDGTPTDIRVDCKCNHEILNRTAIEVLASIRAFDPIPPELGVELLELKIPVDFQLI